MKRLAIVVAMVCGFAAAPATVWSAAETLAQDTVIDRVGDWFATFGKSGMEKDAVLAQRQADRMAKRAEQRANEQAENAEQGLNQAGRDLKKSFSD